MAFRKFANASIVKPEFSFSGWEDLRATSGARMSRQAAKIVLDKFNPNEFMLTHCTIIASVDTEVSPAPLGQQMLDGFQIDRPYNDWLIKSASTPFINNNNDAWERKLLLSCFKTFVGGENYVEHVQIPELSKGKIIDAAARDIGDSIYVDILIATNRKFGPLVSSIQRRELKTLSMGCQVEFTVCSACGNVAYDETQLCNHIRYFKGNEFVDPMGQKRKIAELCGHVTAEPGSVKFIEASWVANPAFEGAVLRSFLHPEDVVDVGKKMSLAFSSEPRVVMPGAMGKAASFLAWGQEQQDSTFDDGMQDQGKSQAPAPAPKDNGLDKAVGDMADVIRQRAVDKVKHEVDGPRPDANENNTLIKEALRHQEWRLIASRLSRLAPDQRVARNLLLGLLYYKNGGWSAVRQANVLSGREILGMARIFDTHKKTAMAGEARLYRTVLQTGGLSSYPNERAYLVACQNVMNRPLTAMETDSLLDKGRLYSMGVDNPLFTPTSA